MNTLHDAFERQSGNAGTLDLDIDELVRAGEQRLRRRRLTVALGAAAAVIATIAISVMATDDTGPPRPGPVNHPPRPEEKVSTRPLVYSDVSVVPGVGVSGFSGDSIHVGHRLVDTGSGFIKMDVTDDGVVYTTGGYQDDGRVWFTDGGEPQQIGSHACVVAHGAGNTVVTDNAGSVAVWFDCTRGQVPALVVYDTASGSDVMRRPIPGCGLRYASCDVYALMRDHIYITWTHFPHGGRVVVSPLQLDLANDRVSKVELPEPPSDPVVPYTYDVAAKPYLDDIRTHPRGLVVGESWETGTPTPFGWGFAVVGGRLVSEGSTSAFDTATHRPVRLNLPAGYHGADSFGVFEWLDDDTVALIGPTGWDHQPGYGDILTCRLSDGVCTLAARGHGPVRLPANAGIPG